MQRSDPIGDELALRHFATELKTKRKRHRNTWASGLLGPSSELEVFVLARQKDEQIAFFLRRRVNGQSRLEYN